MIVIMDDTSETTNQDPQSEASKRLIAYAMLGAMLAPKGKHAHPCPTDACPGDGRYAPPGKGHQGNCDWFNERPMGDV